MYKRGCCQADRGDRLNFVGTPVFDPCSLYDVETLKIYEDPLAYAKDPEECGPPPKVKILTSPVERVGLLRKLANTGRLQLFREDEVFFFFFFAA